MRKRRWGKDEILALSTWLLVGGGAFVLIGTTTSASIALLLANSLQFQGSYSYSGCVDYISISKFIYLL